MRKIIIILLVVVLLILVAMFFKTDDKFQFEFPVTGKITSKFGEKRSTGTHNGIDIAAPKGTEIKAPESGVVTAVWKDAINGNAIKIAHLKGYFTGYAHLNSVKVSLGQKVNKGDVIGTVGSTGRSTGNHLHFTISQFGVNIDPLSILNAKTV